MKTLLFLGLLLIIGPILVVHVVSEKIDKCTLANLWFTRYHLDEQKVGTLICIAMAESDLDIDVINHRTGDYGLYQINNRYCYDQRVPSSRNKCRVTCRWLVGRHKASIRCANHILKREGFSYWKSYVGLCDDSRYAVSLLEDCDPVYLKTYDEDL